MKITKNELRLGNILDFEGETCVVREIDSSGVVVLFNNSEEEWIDLFQFSGIPLTEEWLLKFGFKYGEFLNDFFINEIDGANNLWIKNQLGIKWGVSLNLFHDDLKPIFLKDIKYVHQLQNLFFSLCGEELTLSKTNYPL